MKKLSPLNYVWIALYSVVAIAFLYFICSVKYFYVGTENRGIFLACMVFTILLPACMIVWQIKGERWVIIKNMVALVVLIVSIGTVGLFGLGGICSATTNVEDYRKFDEGVLKQISERYFLFPEQIPEQVTDVAYSYFYRQILDDEIKITLSYTYESLEDFREEKERVISSYTIVSEKEVDGNKVYFSALSDYIVYAVFDDDEQSVTYVYCLNMEAEVN